MGRKLVCYGDSNTFGYDPANWETGRYEAAFRWPDLLQESLGPDWEVIARGLNGRRLPDLGHDRETVEQMISLAGKDGVLLIMLGTNDLLQTLRPDASLPAGRMEALLKFLAETAPTLSVLVTAPVPVGKADHTDALMRRYYEESLRMNRLFGQLSGKYGVCFADAAEWDIDLAYDFVHFSEKGHTAFAAHMNEIISSLNMSGTAEIQR